jgi:hypothetical protein
MSDKFKNKLTDNDTKILFEIEANLGEYKIMHEKWSWDGVYGESIFFANEDITHLNQSDLITLVKSLPLVEPDSTLTYKKSDSGFTFVNFNFHAL